MVAAGNGPAKVHVNAFVRLAIPCAMGYHPGT